ncbi:hypothetical protein SK128_021943 [Halocaridina rubra]|uniref:Kazal-like domain-containing protein n=1 Tax=Halocaridina rubra TaxID=373956 RepID=A0AAN8XRL0_HALRR
MGKSSSSSDVEKESPGNQYALEKKMQDEELVRTSVVPRDEMLVGSEILKGRFTNENFNRHASLENGKCNLNDDHEYESTKSCDNKIILKNQPAKTIIGKFIQKCLPEKQQEGLGEFTKALKRLSKNRVVVYGALADFSAIVAEAGLFFWKAKYQEHQFRVTKSTATLFSGLSGTLSLILGVVGGGIWVSRYRPRAKTVAHLMMSCGIMYMISLVGMMFISCDFQQDLPGILSTDKRSVELYRGCSSGCNCDQKEFIPVCIKDGPISLTYFSPCHAGCPDSNAKPHAEGQDEAFHNCTCGSQQATVTSGYCQDTCSGFILYNVITLIVKSFISVGVIGGTLISLRCVAVEDKAIALGVKSTMLSAALVVNPVIFGSLIDSACLVWEESCNGKGSCWLYNTDDFRYKLHGLPCIFITCCVFFTYMVARHLGELELVEDDSQLSSLSPTSSLFSNSVGERTSSIRRSLKKISSRLMGGEIGLSISPGKEKEISHSVFLRSEQNKNSWDSQGKGKESSHTRSPERNKEKISSRTLKEKTERKHECSEPQSVENAIGINDKSGNILSSGDSMLFNEDSPLSNAVENIHSAKVPKTTGV